VVGTLSEYIPNSWFHLVGIHKVLKRILPRMPDVSGKLFVTLTIDPKSFRDEESGFDYSRDKIRRIFHRLVNDNYSSMSVTIKNHSALRQAFCYRT